MFSRMLRQKENVNGLIRLALPLLMASGLSLAIISNFYNEEIIDLLYTSHASYSSRIFGLLMIGFLFVSTSYIYGTLLTANNNLRQLNLLAASTVLINVTLNLILIPRHQAFGAAVSSLISQGYYAVLQVILATRIVKIPLNGDILLRLAGFLVLNLVTGYLSIQIPGWIPGFSVLFSSCVLSAFLLGLIRIPDILRVLRGDDG
jgi:O-antigen/teichoic acid export membrane protein